MRRRAHRFAIAALTVVVACTSDDDADISAPPVPSATAGPTEPSSEATTPATTATPETATTELNPVPTALTAPPTTTTAPVELPPVSTLVPQVPAELLTPEQLDPFNVNNNRPILPEHLPVIEAYLRASDAFGAAASRSPIDPNAAVLVGAPLTAESLVANQTALQGRADRGEILNVSQGVINRPYVIGPVTDAAVVFDCFLDGEYWVAADGAPIAPTPVWQASPGSIVEVGVRIDVVYRDGEWLYDGGRIDEGACE